jgi:hypothetical protein
MGPGETQHGESFLLKKGGAVGAAEFIGAALSNVCGVPHCPPAIVTIDTLHGEIEHVFGSRMELGLKKFDNTSINQWQAVIAGCTHPSLFSAVLAIDLVLGNDDRHWANWLVQDLGDHGGHSSYRIRAMDFSRGWPVCNPAQHPLRHKDHNTWSAVRNWELLGVKFDQPAFFDACAKMHVLTSKWLRHRVLSQLDGTFLTPIQIDEFCQWWDSHWKNQLIEVIDSIENGARP